MSDSTPTTPTESRPARRDPEALRRKIIFWFPVAIVASVAGSIVTTAFNFLRPRAGEVGVRVGASGDWFPVAKIGDIEGVEPMLRQVAVEHRAGWSTTMRAHSVFVLPGEERRIISAVCPHEGCEVEWSADQKQFLCPCHDSVFNADGARLSGPAQSDLARLPARLNGDTLEMQFGETAAPSTATEAPTNG